MRSYIFVKRYIPDEVLIYLEAQSTKGLPVSAANLAHTFNKSKSMCYKYLSAYKEFQKDKVRLHGVQKRKRLVDRVEFQKFMFNVLDNKGFSSTTNLYSLSQNAFKIGKNSSIKFAKRTFSRYLKEFLEQTHKDDLRVRKYKIKYEINGVDKKGFYTEWQRPKRTNGLPKREPQYR